MRKKCFLTELILAKRKAINIGQRLKMEKAAIILLLLRSSMRKLKKCWYYWNHLWFLMEHWFPS